MNLAYINKRKFIIVSLIYTVLFILFIFLLSYQISRNIEFLNLLKNNVFIFELLMTMIIFIPWIFGVGLNRFNFSLKLKHIIYILIGLSVVKIINMMLGGSLKYNNLVSMSTMIITFVKLLFYPSILEEVVFRGYLQESLNMMKLNIYLVIFIQALLFAFLHLNFFNGFSIVRLLGTFIPGLFLGILKHKTNSLTPCIILHTLINTF